MAEAEKAAVALLVIDDDELFVAGYTSDIKRLDSAGVVDRAWDIKLDNGHRPYLVAKKRINFDITEEPSAEEKNDLTRMVTAKTGVTFAHSLYPLAQTYVFRKTAVFWGDIEVDFSDNDGLPCGKNAEDYYAVYRGCILAGNRGAKLIRL
ncbi:MAG: hypothetical protein P4N41_17655 [Negativicutes bacterium]|nr:hypothetical protein [Negativicutes bacterium]